MHSSWNDMPCTEMTKSCTVCHFRRRPLLTLRGLCSASPFDTHYIMTKEYVGKKVAIKGYFHTRCTTKQQTDIGASSRAPTTSPTNNALSMNSITLNEPSPKTC